MTIRCNYLFVHGVGVAAGGCGLCIITVTFVDLYYLGLCTMYVDIHRPK